MIRRLIVAGFLSLATSPAFAQAWVTGPFVVSACGAESYTAGQAKPMEIDTTGKLCTSASSSGGSVTSQATAVAALPTLGAGAQNLQESLGGGLYVQPVFASTAGGGTQVDATHGLPVQVLAGTAVIGHVITDSGSTTVVTSLPALPAGTNVIGHVIADTGSTTAVTSIPAIPTGSNTIGKVDVLGNAGATLDTTPGGTAATNALQIQGVASMTPVQVAGTGSAGTAATGVVTVQGIASMTKLLVTPDSVALPANQSVNISQINAQTAANGGVTGSLLVEQGCAGQTVANTKVAQINNAASSANLKLVSKVSSQKVYICQINIMAAAATNVALVEGTKTTNECDTSTAGLAGGATAATGWNFAANGGLTDGTGLGIVFKSGSANFDVCLLFSAANQVSGSITYAQF